MRVTHTLRQARSFPRQIRCSVLCRRVAMRCALLTLALCAALVSTAVVAHPHAWIDLEITLEIDDQQRLSAMQQRWTFDPIYSLLLTEDMPNADAPAARTEALDAMLAQLLGNIAEHGYLTELWHGDHQVDSAGVHAASLSINGDDRLVMAFTLMPEQPLHLGEAPLHYRIYDPVFYIHMLHGDSATITLTQPGENGQRDCSVSLRQPRPSASAIARATAVDFGQASADGLGRHFAETVSVQCD